MSHLPALLIHRAGLVTDVHHFYTVAATVAVLLITALDVIF